MTQLAAEAREKGELPEDGRGALPELTRLEAILRDVLAPDVPTYDVKTVQGVDFDEWTYTEGLGCLLVRSQSHEVNTRIELAAAQWDGERAEHGPWLRDLAGKWKLAPVDAADYAGKKVWFAPGANLSYLVNTDNVLRAFGEDARWLLKPHPVTHDGDVKAARRAFGVHRILDRKLDGMAILRACDEVGYTVASELGVLAMLLGKPAHDFSRYEMEGWGCYQPLYRAIRESAEPVEVVVDRVLSCPWSGYIPLATPYDEARYRMEEYRARALELREQYAPVARRLPPYPRPAGR